MTATWYPLGYNIRPKRLQTIAREAVARYGGQLPADEATLLSFKGIGAYTAGAIRSFAFRERAAILDTNVARVLFRVFVGQGDPEEPRDEDGICGRISEALVPVAPRLRLQPGADGFRRDGLRRAQSQVPRSARCRRAAARFHSPASAPAGSEMTRRPSSSPRRSSSATAGSSSRAARRASIWRATGSFPAASASRAKRSPPAWSRELREELNISATVGETILHTSHSYDDRRVELHFLKCASSGTPTPMQGQEMRWVTREDLGQLQFPPADEELIQLLIRRR